DFKDSPDDEEDTRSSQEYLNDLEEEYQEKALLDKYKRFFKKELMPTKDFEAKYNKVKAKLALLSSSASASKASMVKNKGLIIEAYEWDEEVSSDDNEMIEAKVLIALAEDNDAVNKEGARNGEWVKISMRKVHTLREIEDNNDRKNYLEYLSDESSVCNTLFPSLKNLDGAEPISGPKTIKSILKSRSIFRAKSLEGVIINEPSSALAKGNKSSSASKVNSAHAGKLKNVKIKDDLPLAIIIKELNKLKLQISKTQSPHSRILFCKMCKRTNHRTCDHAEFMSALNMTQHLKSLSGSLSRSMIQRPLERFLPPYIQCGHIDHLSHDCLYYPICRLCRSYDHDTDGHKRIISLEREIKPRNLQHVIKICETCGSTVHNITDHYDIEWFKRGEAIQANNIDALKSKKTGSSKANRSKTPTRGWVSRKNKPFLTYLCKYHIRMST
ncbi:hypothetical protein Tco_1140083, partial [Tanacetum coccineum]